MWSGRRGLVAKVDQRITDGVVPVNRCWGAVVLGINWVEAEL